MVELDEEIIKVIGKRVGLISYSDKVLVCPSKYFSTPLILKDFELKKGDA